MKKLFLALILLCFYGCKFSQNNEIPKEQIEEKIELPEGAIPFNYTSLILIDFKVNDTITACFLFDTGSDQLYLDSTFVANSNLKVSNKKKMIQGVGANTPYVSIIENIAIGLDTLSKLYSDVPILKLRSIGGSNIDGIIGTDFFRKYILKVNFDSSYISILNNTEDLIGEGYDTIHLSIIENKTYLRCTTFINDTLDIHDWTMLDLGSAHSMTFTSVIANKYDFENVIKSKYKYENKGLGGKSESYYFRSNKFQLGKFILNKPIMNYSIDKKGALAIWGFSGLLGTNIMKKFNLVFDFPTKKLYFKPGNLFNKHDYANTVGIFGKYSDSRDSYIVTDVIEDSPAFEVGLKSGDTITKLNGFDISSYSYSDIYNLFHQDTIEINLDFKHNSKNKSIKFMPREVI